VPGSTANQASFSRAFPGPIQDSELTNWGAAAIKYTPMTANTSRIIRLLLRAMDFLQKRPQDVHNAQPHHDPKCNANVLLLHCTTFLFGVALIILIAAETEVLVGQRGKVKLYENA